MATNTDFQPPHKSAVGFKKKLKPGRWVALFAVAVCVVLSVLLLRGGASFSPEGKQEPLPVAAPVVPPAPPEPVYAEIKNTVPSGSSITALLGEYFTDQEIYHLNQQSDAVFPFTKICAGNPYKIVTLDGEFSSFIYEIDAEEQLVISREADQINMERQPILYDVVTEVIHGTIESSLFDAIAAIDESPELAYVLADIFGWDINFILDIRVGDTFQALVEKRFREGQWAGYGKVLAAEFVNQGETFKAIRFKDGDQATSFYNEKGENMRKTFLKVPLSFTRISSGFTMHRFHPILKSWKSHPAIDYVAPVGTPIKTVGDGSIYRIGYTKGNGNFIEVRHSNGYATIYLHMKGFARGLKKGTRVSQGQVIGYLGGTGMATGPHLCFRMRHNGAPVNPTKLKAPAAKSVSAEHLAEFQALAAPLLAQLEDKRDHQQVAKLDLSQETSATDHL
ncbi:Murein DD-endopeptidase MepM and murein hydrolase activator NlpD, contain LysM domain [Desulfuromusa kysingii]|uniref:Murein DD-endopeptidase MepM and murein hydrolase activator NlpD, contain LysM domain n=1 Tax=Desulfuromusa kysingii TaxID=37625 RepID=A0A1H3YKC3_9BACT|nr:peptidoglycan DD-metalloendopeptidase family protein [Desulfuromusa kysingii]SEA11877.1 Murein DD-endopeptidase MepM and murein hydrolase activator NlpD, contain LysM domain [Desulfuromusa kysingii]